MKRLSTLALILLGLLATATIASAHHINPRRDYHIPGPLPAGVEQIVINSRFLPPDRSEVGFVVYTPPGYEAEDSARDYPVIYLLHGINGHERNYFSFWPDFESLYTTPSVLSLIEGTVPAELTMPEAIVVFVNGRAQSFYMDFTDEFHGPDSPDPILSERIILKDVIPYMDANYNTIDHRSGRAIEGFSMGGHGALKLSFEYPSYFCSTISYGGAPFEAFPNLQDYPYSGQFLPEDDRISVLAETHRQDIIDYGLRIRLVVGENDLGRRQLNEDLSDWLTLLDIPYDYLPDVPDTRHRWFEYYQNQGEAGLHFHQQCFAATVSTRPDPRPERIPPTSPQRQRP